MDFTPQLVGSRPHSKSVFRLKSGCVPRFDVQPFPKRPTERNLEPITPYFHQPHHIFNRRNLFGKAGF